MESEPNKSLEERLNCLEKYVLSQGKNLKIMAETNTKIAALPGHIAALRDHIKIAGESSQKASTWMQFVMYAMDHLGDAFLVFEKRQQAMLRFLKDANLPASPSAKEVFLDNDVIAREEQAIEHLEHFLNVLKEARKNSNRNGPPENPPPAN